MHSFKQFVLYESSFSNLIKKLKTAFASVRRLKFGQSTKIELKFSGDPGNVLESAGGWQPSAFGVYAEKVAAYNLSSLLRGQGFEITKENVEQLNKEMLEYKKMLETSLKTKTNFAGNPIPEKEVITGLKEFGEYEKKGQALANRVISEITKDLDFEFCKYKILHTGGKEAMNSTADLVIEKMKESEVKRKIEFSLKTYLAEGKTTRGTSKDAFGFLGMAFGVKNMTAKTFEKHKNKFPAEVVRELEFYQRTSRELYEWVDKRKKELKAKGHGLNSAKMAKEEAIKKFGSEIIDLQVTYFNEIFRLGIKHRPEEFKSAVLEVLDLKKGSPILLSAGTDSKAKTIVTHKKEVSPELQRLFDEPLENIQFAVTSAQKAVPKNLQGFMKKQKRHSSTMIIQFLILEEVVYEVKSQIYTNGTAQFSTTSGKTKTAKSVSIEVEDFFKGSK